MSQSLKIDVVSDVACPWCAVGISSLQRALERLGDEVSAEIVLHPFELNPQMPPEGEPIVEHIGRKYGRTEAQVLESQAMIRERGAGVGFTFGARTHIYNTFDAHRLLQWAREEGPAGAQLALKMALLRTYFGDNRDTSNHDVLLDAVEAAGLDRAQARAVLDSGAYAEDVREEESHYQRMGIQSVPSIIFNDRYLVTGGQPPEAFEQAIREIVAKSAQSAQSAQSPDRSAT
ncbi:DsbA family oxidoreductase [Cupriavidus plantarum]|uniref:DsbA family oxidoreductase n=1 Tax=Cupriavidus plantarum TaxID=942865 RepID=UPI001BA5697C|nr:DsbA family oxidoreductase [Cupriavidus plantarum]